MSSLVASSLAYLDAHGLILVWGVLGAGMLYWVSDLTGQVCGLPFGIHFGLYPLGVVAVAETSLVLSVGSRLGAGN